MAVVGPEGNVSAPSGAAGGDLGGSYPNPTVVGATHITANSIAASQLVAGLAGQLLGGTGPGYAYPPGFEIAYDALTSGQVNIASTTEATPTAVIAGTSHTYENAPYLFHFFAPVAEDSSAANGQVYFLLMEDAASIGRICSLDSVAITTQIVVPVVGEFRFTPTAGAHTFGISAFTGSTTGTPNVFGGAGGVNTFVPAFLRVTKC